MGLCFEEKNQVLDAFKEFHTKVKREASGMSLKCVRSDNGGEFLGLFDAYCRSHGIQHKKIVPKTSEHDGVAKRMNWTIIERVRCILFHAKLPKFF